MRLPPWFAVVAAVLLPACCAAATIDFEVFNDGTVLTTQYAGLTFSNAIILTAGVSLNEFEFPPHSSPNVVSDNGGSLSILFSTPISSVGGYFTYADHLTLVGFNASNDPVVTASSAFSNNEALSGVSGSSPNEFLQLNFAGGISRLTITGGSAGGSFALDDLTINATTVPEPNTLWLLGVFGPVLLVVKRGKGL